VIRSTDGPIRRTLRPTGFECFEAFAKAALAVITKRHESASGRVAECLDDRAVVDPLLIRSTLRRLVDPCAEPPVFEDHTDSALATGIRGDAGGAASALAGRRAHAAQGICSKLFLGR
jgi:hypothetical protein